jgi:hypothetical protein
MGCDREVNRAARDKLVDVIFKQAVLVLGEMATNPAGLLDGDRRRFRLQSAVLECDIRVN